MRKQCAGASAAAYVTEHALQRRYPPAPDSFSTHYSSIVLPDMALVSAPRLAETDQRSFKLITVCTMNDLSKGPNVLIMSVAACVKEDMDLQLVLVGDGKYHQKLEHLAANLGLHERIDFLGWLPAGEAIYKQLDQSDLFVLPSGQEGVSRSTIEAMARALPCITSTVGGMPELLPHEDMVPPNDVRALGRKIREVLTDPKRMALMSARNLEKAKEYREKVLSARWTAFYLYLREKTETWLKNKSAAEKRRNNIA